MPPRWFDGKLDRLGPSGATAEFLKSKLEAPGARFSCLRPQSGDPFERAANGSEARLVLPRGPDASSACRWRIALFLGIDKVSNAHFALAVTEHRDPERAGRHREAAPHRRPALARHAGAHVAGGRRSAAKRRALAQWHENARVVAIAAAPRW